MPTSSSSSPQEPSSRQSSAEAMTVEELLSVVMNNTLAVFTTAPDRRADWLETMAKWHAQASRQGHSGFASFLSAVQRLVEEGARERQGVTLEEPYASAWQALLAAVNQTDEALASEDPPETAAGQNREEGQEPQTVRQLLQRLLEDTLAVLTVAPDMAEEWWAHLDEIQAQLEESGDPESARFVAALEQVAQEGPERLLDIDWDQPFATVREMLIGLSDAASAAEAEQEEMTAEQLLPIVVHNTLVAMAGTPERREAWITTLERLSYQAMDLGDYDFAEFLYATERLLEGADPELLDPDLPEPYASVWGSFVAQLGAETDQAALQGPGNLAQILDLIVQTTVHVMHAAPRERETWWHALGDYRSQALEHEDAGFASFLGGVRRVVEGSAIAELDLAVEEPYATAWEALTTQLDN